MKARITIDMQNDFVNPKGALYVKDAEHLVAVIEARAGLCPINVLTACWHKHSDPSFKVNGGMWPVHCLRDEWGSWIYPGLLQTIKAADLVLHKTGYSAFFTEPNIHTGLHGYLRDNWVYEIEVDGVAGDFCVLETCLDAVKLGFATSISMARTKFVNPKDIDRTIGQLRDNGVTVLP